MDRWHEILEELRHSFAWAKEYREPYREPRWFKQREEKLRSLLNLLPLPPLIMFIAHEYRLLLPRLSETPTRKWARDIVERVARSIADGVPIDPPGDDDWRGMEELGPSNLRDGVRELWRSASERQSHPRQARTDSGDAFFACASLGIQERWNRARPGELQRESDLAARFQPAVGLRDPEAARALSQLKRERFRSPLWASAHDSSWNHLLDALEAELLRSARDEP